MKTAITPAYTFNPAAGTLNLSGISGFNIGLLYEVINLTTGQTIYDAGIAQLGISHQSGSTLTLLANMAGMSASDSLQVLYEMPASSSGGSAPYTSATPMTVGTVYAAGRGVMINCTVAGNVSVQLSSGSIVIPVNVGVNTLDNYAVTGINSSGTTATATYQLLS